MPNPGTFKKADKAVCDAFKKPFYFGRKATLKTKTSNGVVFTTSAERSKNKDSGKWENLSKFSGSYEDASGFNVDNLEVNNKHEFTGELSLNGVVDNTKFTLETTLINFDCIVEADKESSVLGVEYSHDNATAILTADPFNKCAGFNVLAGSSGFLVGATTSFGWGNDDESKNGLTNYDGFLGYNGDGYTAGVKTSKKLGVATLSISNKVNDSLDVFFQLGYTVPKKAEKDGDKKDADKEPAKETSAKDQVDIGVALKYKIDGDTSFSAKFDKDANLTAAYQQLLRPNVKLTVSAGVNIDVRTPEKPENTKFGMAFDFGDI